MVLHEVAPVVRLCVSVDMLHCKGAQVVFGVEKDSSDTTLLDGHRFPMVRDNGAIALDATWLNQ